MHLQNVKNTLKVTMALLSVLYGSEVHADQMKLRIISGQPAEIYTAVAKKFMEANPDISVAIETVANDEEMIQALLRGKIVGDIPDVAFPGFQALGVFSENGLNTNLDDFIARDASFKSLAIQPKMIDLASYRGHVVGLPFGVSSPVFYFNADLVQKAGFDPNNIPADWDSILKISKAITALEGHPSGMYFDYYNVSGGQSFALLVLGEGGSFSRLTATMLPSMDPLAVRHSNCSAILGSPGTSRCSRTRPHRPSPPARSAYS
ncbi:extracellular solute-binding protein [Phyllobacterium zundukense]|uniref:Extracellular solute-binding protein n=1 Tax=Phyllobacterium zundukense TaxID=1867719 RepID=A0ACD4CVE1_9HYPH|nr:extracellular solute-binding protein [Phyllobacterium zundukense]UXN57524.1 extracellular solute-binding protein [Phyllobacterium zundukense]